MKFLILNGPNLNMLGVREPDIYGHSTYGDLVSFLRKTAEEENVEIEIYQSNHEGDLVDKIQSAFGVFDGIVINPAAYTHTSIAILDALKAVAIPAVEVHLSNIREREEFRHFSYVSLATLATFMGHGFVGYREAICFLKDNIGK